jgi:hypothetical protein
MLVAQILDEPIALAEQYPSARASAKELTT